MMLVAPQKGGALRFLKDRQGDCWLSIGLNPRILLQRGVLGFRVQGSELLGNNTRGGYVNWNLTWVVVKMVAFKNPRGGSLEIG